MKAVIVTGSSGQLGEAISKNLLEKKNHVIGVDLNENVSLKKYKNFIFFKTDITSEKDVNKFYKNVNSFNLNIYGLVNNAGVAVFSPFEERTEEELMFVTKVNISSKALIRYVFSNDSTLSLNSVVLFLDTT